MDGMQTVAHEAAKNPDTLVFLMACFIVFQVIQLALKAVEMKKDGSKACSVDYHAIKNDVYRAADKVMEHQHDTNEQVRWLKEVHDVRDQNQRLVWWMDPELRNAVLQQTEATRDLTNEMRGMTKEIANFCEKADRVLYQRDRNV